MKKSEFKKLTLDKAKKDLAVPDKKVMKLQKARPILIKFLRFHVCLLYTSDAADD